MYANTTECQNECVRVVLETVREIKERAECPGLLISTRGEMVHSPRKKWKILNMPLTQSNPVTTSPVRH